MFPSRVATVLTLPSLCSAAMCSFQERPPPLVGATAGRISNRSSSILFRIGVASVCVKVSATRWLNCRREMAELALNPNPPKDTDGRREDSGRGWVRELQGRWPGVGVDGRSADGLQSPHRAPKALCGSCDARDGERIRSRGLSRPGWREIAGTLSQLQAGRQAGSGMARSRARARLNCSSQGQRRGRCRVNRRAERVIRPAKAKTRRLRVLVVTVC